MFFAWPGEFGKACLLLRHKLLFVGRQMSQLYSFLTYEGDKVSNKAK